jgi:ribose transport system permease protein
MLVALCAAGYLLRTGQRRLRAAALAVVLGIGAWVATYLLWWLISGHVIKPMPVGAAFLVGVVVGGLVGLLNGALITTLALPPFIVTLATLEAVRGVALYVTDAVPVSLPSDSALRLLHYGSFMGLAPNVWIAVAVLIVTAPILHFTVLGRYAFAIGSNERTARLCGVPVERYKTLCYVISGAAAGVAGTMISAKLGGGFPDEFQGAELTVIAAVVIGGTSLFGGEGTIIGSVLGVLMLGFLYTGCNIANISPHVQRVFIGGTIILAAAADRFRHIGR